MPFDGNDQAEVFGKIRRGAFAIPAKLSDDCVSLLKSMITVDPDQRITAPAALEHPWIKNKGGSKTVNPTSND